MNTDSIWHLSLLADAYKTPASVRYVVESMLVRPSLSILYGAPGTFKSMISAHLALHVVDGRPWLAGADKAGFPTVKGPVLWVDADNGLWRTANRFAALGRQLGIPESAELYYISMPSPPLACTDLDSMLLLRNTMLEVGAVMCVIDNLGLVAGVDENSPMMSTAMANMRILAERTDAAILLVHHQRKTTGVGRAGDSLRGHSSIEAAIDLGLKIVREEGVDSCHLKSTKSRDFPLTDIRLGFHYESQRDGKALAKAGFEVLNFELRPDPHDLIRELLLAIVKERGQVGKTRLAELVRDRTDRFGLNAIRRLIDEMVENGSLFARRQGTSWMISQNGSKRLPF